MNVYVYGGLNRYTAMTNIVPSNTPAGAGEIFKIDYQGGMFIVAYPNADVETDFEFRYKLISYAREIEEFVEPLPEEEAEPEPEE